MNRQSTVVLSWIAVNPRRFKTIMSVLPSELLSHHGGMDHLEELAFYIKNARK